MDCKPKGRGPGEELWCLDSTASVSSTSAVRGAERSHWGVGGVGWLTFASRPLGWPEQFMNDSPHCQADSLLAWGLAGG